MRVTMIALTALALGCAPAAAAGKNKPFIQSYAPCGSERDVFSCGTVRSNGPFYLNGAQFKFKGAGTVLVTWSGSVFCDVKDVDSGGAANSVMEYYLHLNIGEGASVRTVNEPGSASVGERINVRATTSDVGVGRTMLTPVTLSKTFEITEAGPRTYRALATGDFRTVGANSFCNVNGGVITAVFQPK